MEKHKIRSKRTSKPAEEQNKCGYKKKNFATTQSFCSLLGPKSFEIVYHGTEVFYLAPFKRTPNGKCFPLDFKSEKIRHYAALALALALAMQTVELALKAELKMATFMCGGLFLTYFGTLMIGMGIGRSGRKPWIF